MGWCGPVARELRVLDVHIVDAVRHGIDIVIVGNFAAVSPLVEAVDTIVTLDVSLVGGLLWGFVGVEVWGFGGHGGLAAVQERLQIKIQIFIAENI